MPEHNLSDCDKGKHKAETTYDFVHPGIDVTKPVEDWWFQLKDPDYPGYFLLPFPGNKPGAKLVQMPFNRCGVCHARLNRDTGEPL